MTTPTDDDLAYVRELTARHADGDPQRVAAYAAYQMASRLGRIGTQEPELDDEHVRMARAYGQVYRDNHPW